MAATVAQPSPVPGGGVGQEYNLNSCGNVENGAATSSDSSQHQKVPPRHQQLSPKDFNLVRTLGTGIPIPLLHPGPHKLVAYSVCTETNYHITMQCNRYICAGLSGTSRFRHGRGTGEGVRPQDPPEGRGHQAQAD